MRRLWALIRKESLQIVRDPSAILIAFILPVILLFIFGYGVNLDTNRVRIGLVLEEYTAETNALAATLRGSKFLAVTQGQDRREMQHAVTSGALRGFLVVPKGFTAQAAAGGSAAIQVVADGSEPNIASFVQNYAKAVTALWVAQQALEDGQATPATGAASLPELSTQSASGAGPLTAESRFWYNPELKSRNFLLPGSIAIVMTLIGTLLTALVVAREWERGTMEALMATPVSIIQLLLGKLIPYFLLALSSMAVCFLAAVFWYDVPFRGSFPALLAVTSVFLLAALGQGLLISSLAKDQFLAAQVALISAFLPAFMLSGFIFEITAMPTPIRTITFAFAARYFVSALQTLFLVGNVWPLLLASMGAMGGIALVFFLITARKSVKRLDV